MKKTIGDILANGGILTYLLLGIAIILYVAHACSYGQWINDDAGISFTYARNLADGAGLVLNPGGERVEGYSNPLWVFLLSIFFKLGIFHPIFMPKVLSAILTVFTLILLFRSSQKIAPNSPIAPTHAIGPILLAITPSFVIWSISGLENSLYAFLLMAAFYRFQIEVQHAPKFPHSALLVFLVSITRPEGIIYSVAFLVVISVLTVRQLFFNKSLIRYSLLWLTLLLGPLFIYHMWHYGYFAHIFPNTYYAKAVDDNIIDRFNKTIREMESPGWIYVKNSLGLYYLTIPTIVSILVLFVLRGISIDIIIIIIFMAASLFFPIYVRGDWMRGQRMMTQFFPLAFLSICAAISVVFNDFRSGSLGKSSATRRFLHLAGLIILLFMCKFGHQCYTIAKSERDNLTVPFAAISRRGEHFAWLARSANIKDASLLEPDLGGTAYYSGLKLVDFAGLADVAIARHGWSDPHFREYILYEKKPTFIHTHGTWSHRSGIHSLPEFRRDYVALWEKRCVDKAFVDLDILDGDYFRRDIFTLSEYPSTGNSTVQIDSVLHMIGHDKEYDAVLQDMMLPLTTYWQCLNKPSSKAKYEYSLELHSVDDDSVRSHVNIFSDSSLEYNLALSSGGKRSSSESRNGRFSWQATDAWDGVESPGEFGIANGQQYLISTWIKNTGDNAVRIMALIDDSTDHKDLSIALEEVPAHSDWMRVKAIAQWTKPDSFVKLRLEIDRPSENGAIYFDDILVTLGSELHEWEESAESRYLLMHGWYLPDHWAQGEVFQDRRLFKIPPALKSGDYILRCEFAKNGRHLSSADLCTIQIGKQAVKKVQNALQTFINQFLESGDYESAYTSANQALAINPIPESVQIQKQIVEERLLDELIQNARSLIDQNKLIKAADFLARCIEINRKNSIVGELSKDLSKLLQSSATETEQDGDMNNAFGLLQAALFMDSDNPSIRKEIERIRPLKDRLIWPSENTVEIKLPMINGFISKTDSGLFGMPIESSGNQLIGPFKLPVGEYRLSARIVDISTSLPRVDNGPILHLHEFISPFDNSDFEVGNLTNWLADGRAFLNQPTYSDNAVHRGKSTVMEGQYYVGTFENRRSSAAPRGEIQGDGPTGSLTSNEFRIRYPELCFMPRRRE